MSTDRDGENQNGPSTRPPFSGHFVSGSGGGNETMRGRGAREGVTSVSGSGVPHILTTTYTVPCMNTPLGVREVNSRSK